MTWTAPARECVIIVLVKYFSSKKRRGEKGEKKERDKNILSVEVNYSNSVFGSYELGECLNSR